MTSAFALDRIVLQRVVAVANGKGGVGKTSVAAHIAAAAARGGRRVLLIDLDPQSNLQDNLGYVNEDLGLGMVRAVIASMPPIILRDVRPNLDVIPGGVELEKLVDTIQGARNRATETEQANAALLMIAAVIAPIAGGYDLIIVDCPPANSGVLQDAALAMAAYLLIPTKTDMSSRRGIAEMARRFVAIRASVNPGLSLLGVLLFTVGRSATSVGDAARKWIRKALGEQAPVFDTGIRHAERPAFDIRETGRLAFEMAADPSASTAMAGLARDYLALTKEVFARLVEIEEAR